MTVRGRGSVVAQPDEVVLLLEVAALRDAPAAAFTDVEERTRALEAVLDDVGIAESDRSTRGITVHEHHEHDPAGPPRTRHRAVNGLSVRLSGADQVPALLRAAVERAQAHVQGPSWRLADPSQARLEACTLAAEDARRRAQAYGDALEVVATVEVTYLLEDA